jgi:hypothetical protein
MSNRVDDIYRSEMIYLQVGQEPKGVQLGRENLWSIFFNPGIRSGLSSRFLIYCAPGEYRSPTLWAKGQRKSSWTSSHRSRVRGLDGAPDGD